MDKGLITVSIPVTVLAMVVCTCGLVFFRVPLMNASLIGAGLGFVLGVVFYMWGEEVGHAKK